MNRISHPRRALAAIATATAALLVISGCSSSGTPPEAKTLTWALASAPQSLDIAKAISAVSYTVQSSALETLAHVAGDGKVTPWLAKSWTNPDPTTYVFELRDDVKFWDGDPLTADDVAFSLNRLSESSSLISYDFASMKSATATAPNEVTVTLKNIDPLFLSVAIATDGLIVQKSFAEKAGDALGDPTALTMGTGPYQIKTFSKTSDTVLSRYEGYWGTAPAAETLKFTTITDSETMRIALTQGQVDGTFDASVGDTERFKSSSEVTATLAPGVAMEYLSLDVRSAPLSDVHVRRAIAYAIDKKGLVTAQLKDNGAVSNLMMTALQANAMFGKDGNELVKKIDMYDFNVDSAKAELAKSAYPQGFTTPVMFAEYDSVVFQVLQENLKAIGITLEGKPVSADQFYSATGQIDQPQGMVPVYSGYGSLDPWEALRSVLGEANTSGYSSDVTKAGLATLSTDLDPKTRQAAIED